VKPVFQDRFTVPIEEGGTVEGLAPEDRGNCLQAAFASVFELELKQVPHFVAMPADTWWSAVCDWLAERNIAVQWAPIGNGNGKGWAPLGAYFLATGTSPRGNFQHVVVMRDWEMVHDPHPSGDGLAELRGAYFFIVADPTRQPVVTTRA
jgi:hypothetical protein